MERVGGARSFIQVVLGPRQVGKTTMVTQLLSHLAIPNLYESVDALFLQGILHGSHRCGSRLDCN
ncbi:MAG: hypothetical protein ACK5IQ_02875 [Bacteroidales bacterium]